MKKAKSTPNPEWTEEKVKKELPMVKLQVGPRVILTAVTSGRMLDYCVVSVYSHMNLDVPQVREMRLEFSWAAVTRSLNENKPLQI